MIFIYLFSFQGSFLKDFFYYYRHLWICTGMWTWVQVPTEARNSCHICWSRSWRWVSASWCECWKLKSGAGHWPEMIRALTVEPSLQPQFCKSLIMEFNQWLLLWLYMCVFKQCVIYINVFSSIFFSDVWWAYFHTYALNPNQNHFKMHIQFSGTI